MKTSGIRIRFVAIMLSLFLVIVVGFSSSSSVSASVDQPEGAVVVRLYYTTRTNLDSLANRLDFWEVHPEEAYLVTMVSPQEYTRLNQQGYRMEIDSVLTAQMNAVQQPLPGQGTDSIPGYPCYRTVDETYQTLSSLAANHPSLASWIDIGDSWEKVTPGGNSGYDIFVLDLTNKIKPGPKPTLFLMSEIHAREYTTAETAARFAEYLVNNFGTNPDITWLLNYYHIYILPMTNPDGRVIAETGDYWRKNTDNDDGCSNSSWWGTDLNRNHSFKWDTGGSSDYPCDETYHGPTAGSEPEVQAVQDFVLSIFLDQRGPNDSDPAPLDATGALISLHSYSQLVLWPWGWTPAYAPNHTQLQTLGRKLAYFNNYTPQQAYQLYPTSGTSDDWSYGELGIASYTFEMGTTFFQDCSTFENTIYPNNRDALLYAFKAARHPYMDPSGPDSLNVTVTPSTVQPGSPVTLDATANDTRYRGGEPTQNIAAARYTIDSPSWITGTVTYPMAAADGNFNAKIEDVTASVETSCLAPGNHTLFVEGQDVDDNWGVPGSVFLNAGISHGIGISPSTLSQNGAPGQSVVYPLSVENLGNTWDTFTVTLTSGWTASAPLQISNLEGCSSSVLTVTVDVPGSAEIGMSDVANVTLASHADPAQTATAVITTSVIGSPPEVVPLNDSMAGDPGQTVVYSLSVTNTNDLTDTFDILTSSVWPVQAPATIGPLAFNGNASLPVTITIPITATGDMLDITWVAIASQNPGIPAITATLTTTVNSLYVFSATVSSYQQVVLPGELITYTFYLTNTGNIIDTLDVSVNGTWSTITNTQVGPLAPGENAMLDLVMQVPSDAWFGDFNETNVMITSQGDTYQYYGFRLITFIQSRIYMPLVEK